MVDYMYTTACAIAAIASHRIPWPCGLHRKALARDTRHFALKNTGRTPIIWQPTKCHTNRRDTCMYTTHVNCVPGGAAQPGFVSAASGCRRFAVLVAAALLLWACWPAVARWLVAARAAARLRLLSRVLPPAPPLRAAGAMARAGCRRACRCGHAGRLARQQLLCKKVALLLLLLRLLSRARWRRGAAT